MRAGLQRPGNVLPQIKYAAQTFGLFRQHGVRDGLLHWKRIETLFREIERENHLILEAVGEGIYGVDAEGRATFINSAAERMLGWSRDDLLGRAMHSVIHHTHCDGRPHQRESCPIYRAFRDGAVHRVNDDYFWCRDGTGFPVEYTSTPILDNDQLVGAVVVFRDISERRRTEDSLKQALDEVGEIPLSLQSKLLRVLQEQTFERLGACRALPLKALALSPTIG